MPIIREICDHLEQVAPCRLAEDWDNVGLLVGDSERKARRVMTCLTVTPDGVHEAIAESADLIVTHHPMPFRSLKKLTVETTAGRLIWNLVGAQISVYSPHTAWDSASGGINQMLAEGLQLSDIVPLQPIENDPDGLGAGRYGVLATPIQLSELAARVQQFLSVDGVHCVGQLAHAIERVAVACGSAGTFLGPACRAGCDALLTGETDFHTCLEAQAQDVALVLPGHYASERFSLDQLASGLSQSFPDLKVWASRRESDPLHWVC